MKSLDPRVNRLPGVDSANNDITTPQLCTFEVFVQPRAGKPFQHEGAVHAPNAEMAFVIAKETFTRRFTCVALWVVETARIFVTPTTDGSTNAYNILAKTEPGNGNENIRLFEIFHLPKRGKQHVHFRSEEAKTPEEAIITAKQFLDPSQVFFNVWAVAEEQIRKTNQEELDLWTTLPEKKFRDATAYKGGEKLQRFLEQRQSSNE